MTSPELCYCHVVDHCQLCSPRILTFDLTYGEIPLAMGYESLAYCFHFALSVVFNSTVSGRKRAQHNCTAVVCLLCILGITWLPGR